MTPPVMESPPSRKSKNRPIPRLGSVRQENSLAPMIAVGMQTTKSRKIKSTDMFLRFMRSAESTAARIIPHTIQIA